MTKHRGKKMLRIINSLRSPKDWPRHQNYKSQSLQNSSGWGLVHSSGHGVHYHVLERATWWKWGQGGAALSWQQARKHGFREVTSRKQILPTTRRDLEADTFPNGAYSDAARWQPWFLPWEILSRGSSHDRADCWPWKLWDNKRFVSRSEICGNWLRSKKKNKSIQLDRIDYTLDTTEEMYGSRLTETENVKLGMGHTHACNPSTQGPK